MHSSFLKPDDSAALINISGCGFEACRSAPLSLAVKYLSKLNLLKILLIVNIEAEDAKTSIKSFFI